MIGAVGRARALVDSVLADTLLRYAEYEQYRRNLPRSAQS